MFAMNRLCLFKGWKACESTGLGHFDERKLKYIAEW